MTHEKQKTAVDLIIDRMRDSINYLNSCLQEATDEKSKIQYKARLAQARLMLNYTLEIKKEEKEQMINFANDYFTKIDSSIEFTNAEIFFNETFE